MREYLDLEFRDIESALPFDYNLEQVIDNFILLAFFVRNDFLPNIPDLQFTRMGWSDCSMSITSGKPKKYLFTLADLWP